MSEQAPVHLPSRILRSSAPVQVQRTREPVFTVARRTDNELILFDEPVSESWIIYPPRSAYEFLPVRRRSIRTTIVEHHPWSAALDPVDHELDAREGCLQHGLNCPAQLAISAAVRFGYDPFT